jgi:hypothetical protein
LWAYKIQ